MSVFPSHYELAQEKNGGWHQAMGPTVARRRQRKVFKEKARNN